MRLGTARDRRSHSWLRRLAWMPFVLVLGVIVYATVTPISLRPNSGHLHPERMLAYFALGAALSLAKRKRPLTSAVIVTLIACGLEYLQTFIPTRDGRWPDAVEKAMGGVVGVLFAELLVRLFILWSGRGARSKPTLTPTAPPKS